MLSQRLANFAEYFAVWGSAALPTRMEPSVAARFADEFRDLAQQVAVLENQPVPPHLQAIPAGIARLDVARAQRRHGLPVTGGAAA